MTDTLCNRMLLPFVTLTPHFYSILFESFPITLPLKILSLLPFKTWELNLFLGGDQ